MWPNLPGCSYFHVMYIVSIHYYYNYVVSSFTLIARSQIWGIFVLKKLCSRTILHGLHILLVCVESGWHRAEPSNLTKWVTRHQDGLSFHLQHNARNYSFVKRTKIAIDLVILINTHGSGLCTLAAAHFGWLSHLKVQAYCTQVRPFFVAYRMYAKIHDFWTWANKLLCTLTTSLAS